MKIQLNASSRVTVKLPLWTANGVGPWSQVLVISPTIEEVRFDAENSSAILVTGAGAMTLEGCLEKGGNTCCAEGYLGGTWSWPAEGNQTNPRDLMRYESSGSASISVDYQASSSYCGGGATVEGVLSNGAGALPASAGFSCT